MPRVMIIKMRFWCNEHGFVAAGFNERIEAVYFNQRDEVGLTCPLCFKSRPMTVELYTGRDDKNGTPVFDGDVVRYSRFDNLAAVEWTEDLCQWSVCQKVYDGDGTDDYTLEAENIDPDCDIEVVGNIHENPELDV